MLSLWLDITYTYEVLPVNDFKMDDPFDQQMINEFSTAYTGHSIGIVERVGLADIANSVVKLTVDKPSWMCQGCWFRTIRYKW